MILYNVKTDGLKYRITKFDDDMNVESSYLMLDGECECPAREVGRTCRHQKMLPIMIDRLDSAWFFCFDDGTWHDPTGEASAPAPDLSPSIHTIKCKTTGEALADKLDGGWCLCKPGVCLVHPNLSHTGGKDLDPSKFTGFTPAVRRRV